MIDISLSWWLFEISKVFNEDREIVKKILLQFANPFEISFQKVSKVEKSLKLSEKKKKFFYLHAKWLK